MIYPQKLNSKKSNLILKLGVVLSVIVAILLVLINKLTTPQIPWAAITNGGIIYIWIVLFYSIRKNINIAIDIFNDYIYIFRNDSTTLSDYIFSKEIGQGTY